jgi:hypothetical protein
LVETIAGRLGDRRAADLNPIEQAFSRRKTKLRKAGERTRDGLWQSIGRSIELFPPANAATSLTTRVVQLDRNPL